MSSFTPQERIFFLQLILNSDRGTFGADLLKSFSKYFCSPSNIVLITDVHLTNIQKLADVGDVIRYICNEITGFPASESLTTLFTELQDIKNRRIFLPSYVKLVEDFITKNTPATPVAPLITPVVQQPTAEEQIIDSLKQEITRLKTAFELSQSTNSQLQRELQSLQSKYDQIIQSLKNINF